MYLPRNLISHLYNHLLRTHHPLSPPVLILVALEPDALCACRILTALLKRDYIAHKIQPISGYGDLARAGEDLVRPMRTTDGGSGGVVICLGVGGLVDLENMFGLEVEEDGSGGMGDVEVWVFDARRPWNLANVFGGLPEQLQIGEQGGSELLRKRTGVDKGRVTPSYTPGRGGIFVFDDGDIEEQLGAEREAYCTLAEMPEVDEDEDESDSSDADEERENEEDAPPVSGQTKKRKSWSDRDEETDSEDEDRPTRRRRSNSSSPIPSSPDRPERPGRRGLLSAQLGGSSDFSRSGTPRSRSTSPAVAATPKQPSARALRRRLLRLRRENEKILQEYYSLGTSYSEPISSMVYSLASELGREDNDLLWHAIVGVSSLELYGRTLSGVGAKSTSGWTGDRGERIRATLRDEVRRLNPTDLRDVVREHGIGEAGGVIPTHATSPTDMSIRLSPEPRFLLIRHWSLYDSMLHSPYLSARLHLWSDAGRRRLHKLLAKMGVSLSQCRQSYTHMDMDLKRGLRERLLKFAPVYGLDGLVPPASERGAVGKEGWGFVRCWGWKACLSALDVGVVLGAILEVGDAKEAAAHAARSDAAMELADSQAQGPQGPLPNGTSEAEEAARLASVQESITARFWLAYDALGEPRTVVAHIPTAQHLHRAILRTGTALVEKRQIRHLRAFRMAVVKEGPDVRLFTHPGALVKLALWVQEAVAEMEGKREGGATAAGKGMELVMAGLDEVRGTYVVVGLGGGGSSAVVVSRERERRREARRKEREKKREARRREKEEERRKRRERRLANGMDEDSEEEEDEDETEMEDDSDSESEDEAEATTSGRRGAGRNRFGLAFQEVIEETGARVRVDSFEHSVVEVRKEDLSGFLERLSLKTVVG